MLETNLIGFYKEKEYLPKDFDEFDSVVKLRQLFLSLSNNTLKPFCNFSKYEQKKLSNSTLEKAFIYKIKNMLPISNVKKYEVKSNKIFKVCINSTKVIHNYLNKERKSIIVSNNGLLKVARLISTCFIDNKLQLLIDKDLLFHDFVYKKIKKLHSDKSVINLGNSISIQTENSIGVKIYTSWKDIKKDDPNIKNELENAIQAIKNGEFNQVYLAYPKNEQFTKQIPVYVDELKHKEYQIKAIPYSLRSIIR